MTRPQLVWLDIDPGFDDLASWLMLSAAPGVDLQGVSTVAGNAPLPDTFDNAVRAHDFFRLPHPVYPGRDRPLSGTLVTSQHLLGRTGLASVDRTLPRGRYAGERQDGVEALIAAARALPGELRVLALGPLTNLATALQRAPDLARLLREVVWMGGSSDQGNHTAAAEFNAFADPEAADAVLTSGVPFVLVGLNLTRQVVLDPTHLQLMRSWPGERAQLLADHLEFYLSIRTPGRPGAMPFHDPCAALWLLHPELFESVPAHVRVELDGTLTRGMTVCEFRVPARAVANATVVTRAQLPSCQTAITGLLYSALTSG
ncbi:nucleoside hydrolase [Deinococcus sp. QL22]|uniref:nucleoside hydrolase n=1 Tax=Deinococcus sp. QL22 TaxID=2939437 RepID=UPI0020173E10|nr:nucleoside hydrolase [Deinococcus sp. QL22]UQN08959.1 nucleoside hydrolase [Deinococcus sp. QL22]